MLECSLLTGLTTVPKQHYSVSIMISAWQDNNNDIILVLLDLSSAFDGYNHQILLKRLQDHYGIYGTVLDWLKSYLSEPTQSVEIGDETSEPIHLARGVPQGPVLQPTLFSLYVAPIEDILKRYGLNFAVYDKSLLQSGISNLEKCIEAVLEWFADNQLVCNESKTVGKSNVVLASSVHDLGVTLDCHLDMKSHVNQLCKSAYFSLRHVGQVRRYLDYATTEKLTHARITSKLQQCNS